MVSVRECARSQGFGYSYTVLWHLSAPTTVHLQATNNCRRASITKYLASAAILRWSAPAPDPAEEKTGCDALVLCSRIVHNDCV